VASTCNWAYNPHQFGIGTNVGYSHASARNRCEVLARIDREIAEGERHVSEQMALIKWMTEECLGTTLAEKLLLNLQQILEGWHVHRRLMLEANPQDEAADR
jgi:hypothetical protein